MSENFGPGLMGGVVLVDPISGQPYKAADFSVADLTNPATPAGASLSSTYVSGVRSRVPRVPTAALPIESPYDLAGTAVHPDVIDTVTGFGADANGKAWRYWMVYTPYWRSQTRYENPCIQVSDDGLNWITPAGLTNPIDAKPGGTAVNSDPDMILVGGTLYCYYREYDGTAPGNYSEKIQLRTSTNGITWTAEATVLSTTAASTRTKMISPAFLHDGSQFVVYYSNDGAVIRRTSTDGTTWTAETVCTVTPTLAVSHIDAMRSTDGRVHLFLQDSTAPSTAPTVNSARKIWLGKSASGTAFTVGPIPLLISEHMAQRMIYRACGIWEARGGKDYYRIWASCTSYSVATNAADYALQAANSGVVESYYVGFTEGYDPNDPDPSDKSQVVMASDLVSTNRVRADEVGSNRLFSRFAAIARAVFDRIRAVEIRAQHLVVNGPNISMLSGGVLSEQGARYGYVTTGLPSMIVSSGADTTGQTAGIAFHYGSGDNTKTAKDGWQLGVDRLGALLIQRRTTGATDGTTTLVGYFDATTGQLILTNGINVTGSINLGSLPFISGDRLRLMTAKTPTSGADLSGGVGDIARDDNYIYCKTSTGWKRSPLTTW